MINFVIDAMIDRRVFGLVNFTPQDASRRRWIYKGVELKWGCLVVQSFCETSLKFVQDGESSLAKIFKREYEANNPFAGVGS